MSSDAHVVATRDAYERYAEAYAHHRSDRSSVRPHIEQFAALLPGGAKVLDVGCGPGVDTGSLALRGLQTVALDIAAAMLQMAAPHTDGRVVQADQRALPFPDASFDGVWARCSLHHVTKAELRVVAAEIARVLRPTGLVSLTMALGLHDGFGRCDDGVDAERWYSSFEPDELRSILRRAAIDVIDAVFDEGTLTLLARRRS
jgi:SAM-dependent methyltransferase